MNCGYSFEPQKYEKYQKFISECFQFLVVKFSIYWNRRVYVMTSRFLNMIRREKKSIQVGNKNTRTKIGDWFQETFYETAMFITKTCLYNFDPLKPHFYVAKLGFTGVYIIFLISPQKHRLWVLVRTASARRF